MKNIKTSQPFNPADRYAPADFCVEPVGKDPVLYFLGNVKKSESVKSSTIDDLMNGRGKVTPEKSIRTISRSFSTGSLCKNK
jgi:hypothetical protein